MKREAGAYRYRLEGRGVFSTCPADGRVEAAGLRRAGRAGPGLLHDDGVDDVGLAPDAVPQLARHVRDGPADDYHHQRHDVLRRIHWELQLST